MHTMDFCGIYAFINCFLWYFYRSQITTIEEIILTPNMTCAKLLNSLTNCIDDSGEFYRDVSPLIAFYGIVHPEKSLNKDASGRRNLFASRRVRTFNFLCADACGRTQTDARRRTQTQAKFFSCILCPSCYMFRP